MPDHNIEWLEKYVMAQIQKRRGYRCVGPLATELPAPLGRDLDGALLI